MNKIKLSAYLALAMGAMSNMFSMGHKEIDLSKVNWSANIVDHRYHQNIRARKLKEAQL